MATVKKPRSASKSARPIKVAPSAAEIELAKKRQRIATHLVALFLCLVGVAVGLKAMKEHVEKRIVFLDAPPRVVLKERPPWMSDFLAEQILSSVQPMGARSAFDRELLVDVGTMLKSNPWIKTVRQVRRAYAVKPGDTIEIDCDFRAPVALIHWKDYFWLVDGDGVKLPEQFTAQQVPRILLGSDGKMNIRIVEGVRQPPVESGHKWQGDDLAAGLDLIKLLYGKPFVEEVVKVDVSNFGGRDNAREAQLTLVTRHGTGVKWGRAVNAKDFFVEVSTAQKLKYLEEVYGQYGRVDAGQPWIDIRFDKITYPSPGSAEASTGGMP